MASQSQWFNAGISMKVHRESLDMQRKTVFLLHFSRFFVILATPNLLCTRICKEKQVFLLHFSRFFVILPSNLQQ